MCFGEQVKGRRGRAGQVGKRPVRVRGPGLGNAFNVRGKPGERPSSPHGIKRKQPNRRTNGPGHGLIGSDPRGLAWRTTRSSSGNPKHDGMMRPAPVLPRSVTWMLPARGKIR